MLQELKECLEEKGYGTVTIAEIDGKKVLTETLDGTDNTLKVVGDFDGDWCSVEATVNHEGSAHKTSFKVNINEDDAVEAACNLIAHQLEYWDN